MSTLQTGSRRRAFAALVLLTLLPSASMIAQSAQSTGRLEGTVTDSLRVAPFAGATVRATRIGSEPEVTLSVVSDQRGRYRFDRLDTGSYALSVGSPLLDSLEYGGPARRVSVSAQGTTRVELGTPSRHTLQRMACPGVTLPEGMGALVGTVTSTENEQPLPGAQIAVAWAELAIDTLAKQVTSGQRAARVAADDAGQFRMCGVPMGEWLLVQVQHGGRAGAVVRTFVGGAGVAVRHLSFNAAGARPLADSAAAPLPEGDALLAGTVLRIDGTPIAGAQVQVLGTAGAARTDEQGRFTVGRLPAGSLEVEVRHFGFAAVRRTVDLRGGRTTRTELRLERAIALDSVRVVAQRLKYPDFEKHRQFNMWGTFLDEEEIARRHATFTSELVYTLPGYWVIGGGPGAKVVSTRSALMGGNCAPNIVIDNMPDQRINDVPASQVAAIESYAKGGGPPQFQQPCGLIMIWTKR